MRQNNHYRGIEIAQRKINVKWNDEKKKQIDIHRKSKCKQKQKQNTLSVWRSNYNNMQKSIYTKKKKF